MEHPSHPVESHWRTSLRNRIIQASSLLEVLLSGLVLIGLLFSVVPLIRWMPGLLFDGNEAEIRTFLERSLDIVIGIEFIKMLAKHSPGSSLEVLLYAIARHLVVGHDSALENLLSVGAIALIFIVRKFFFVPAFGAHLPDGGNTHIEPVIADEIQGIDGMRKRHGKPAGIQVRRTGKFPFVTGLLCRFYYCIETYPAASDFRIAANNGSTLVDGA